LLTYLSVKGRYISSTSPHTLPTSTKMYNVRVHLKAVAKYNIGEICQSETTIESNRVF